MPYTVETIEAELATILKKRWYSFSYKEQLLIARWITVYEAKVNMGSEDFKIALDFLKANQ
jgi:hypothetical protein